MSGEVTSKTNGSWDLFKTYDPYYDPFKALDSQNINTEKSSSEEASKTPSRMEMAVIAAKAIWATFLHALSFAVKTPLFIVKPAVMLFDKLTQQNFQNKFPTAATIALHFSNVFIMPIGAIISATIGIASPVSAIKILSKMHISDWQFQMLPETPSQDPAKTAPPESTERAPSTPLLDKDKAIAPNQVPKPNPTIPTSGAPEQAPSTPLLHKSASQQKKVEQVAPEKAKHESDFTYQAEDLISLHFATNNKERISFAKSKLTGKLIAVSQKSIGKDYHYYPTTTPLFTLLTIAQQNTLFDDYKNPIRTILNHEANQGVIQPKDFFDLLLDYDFSTQKYQICSLSNHAIVDILEGIKSGIAPYAGNITLESLKKIKNSKGDTFFSLVASHVEASTVELMMSMGLADNCRGEALERIYIEALLSKYGSTKARNIADYIEKNKITLSPTTSYIVSKKSFKPGTKIELTGEDKQKVFEWINEFGDADLVKAYRSDLNISSPPSEFDGMSYISPNMDKTEAQEALNKFVADLRQNNLLMTSKEFEQFQDKDQYEEMPSTPGYPLDIGGLWTSHRLQTIIKDKNLEHVRARKMFAVSTQSDKISCIIDDQMNPKAGEYSIKLYREKIKSPSHNPYITLSPKEMQDLQTIAQHTNYRVKEKYNYPVFDEEGKFLFETRMSDFPCNTEPSFKGEGLVKKYNKSTTFTVDFPKK